MEELQLFYNEFKNGNFDFQKDLIGESKFFLLYNNCFSFFLGAKTKNLFSDEELDLQPWISNLDKFSSRKEEDFGVFQYELLTKKGDKLFDAIWDKFGVYFGGSFLARQNSSMLLDLQKKNIFLCQILEHKEREKFTDIDVNLLIFFGIYNFYLKQFIESLSIRRTLIEFYEQSVKFPLLQEEVLKNILSLDKQNNDLAFQLLTYKTRCSHLLEIVEKQRSLKKSEEV